MGDMAAYINHSDGGGDSLLERRWCVHGATPDPGSTALQLSPKPLVIRE